MLALFAELAVERGLDPAPTAHAAEAMLLWGWGHNVRGLRNLVEAFGAVGDVGPLDLDFLIEERPLMAQPILDRDDRPPRGDDGDEGGEGGGGSGGGPHSGGDSPSRPGREAIIEALRRAGGNVAEAARLLGISRLQMYRLMKRYGIDPDDYRA